METSTSRSDIRGVTRIPVIPDELMDDIHVPDIEVPELDVLPSSRKFNENLFSEHKRAAWKDVQTAEARCDFAPNRMRLTNRGAFFISLWKKSIFGRTLTDIKSDDDMIPFFADNMIPLIKGVLGEHISAKDYAIVATPKRRHKERNFATLIAERIAERLEIPFYDDCAISPNRHRIGTIFKPNNIPPQRNVIVYDDFVTSGGTIVSMQQCLRDQCGKNCIFFASINNKL